jgi:protocatechuate 3,4-dioxygenase alpha subunit
VAQAPHIDVSIFARGLLKRLVTRIYFPDDAEANSRDRVLAAVEDADARATLMATRTPDGYRFDIRLQGDGETCFFDV